MIIKGTIIKISDNTGVKSAKVIQIYNKKYAKIGDIIKCCIKKTNQTLKFKKGKMVKVLIINTKKQIKKKPAIISYNINSGIILDINNNILGTKIKTTIIKKLFNKEQKNIIKISKSILII